VLGKPKNKFLIYFSAYIVKIIFFAFLSLPLMSVSYLFKSLLLKNVCSEIQTLPRHLQVSSLAKDFIPKW
jgi:hypothetical protein